MSAAERSRIGAELEKGIDWNPVLAYARQWQLEPVVCTNMIEFFSERLDADTLAAATSRKRLSRAKALAKSVETVELTNAMSQAGIETIVLKGAALSISAYDDPSFRTSNDIDLLVRKSDFPGVRDFLVSRGYNPDFDISNEARIVRNQDALSFSKVGRSVDVHWTLLSRHLRMNFDVDELWATSRLLSCAGSQIRVLSRSHEFLFLCAHGAKHEWMGARWIVDIAQAAARMTRAEGKELYDLAVKLRAKRMLRLALRLAAEIAGETNLPVDLHDSVKEETDLQVGRIRTQIFGVGKLSRKFAMMSRIDPQLSPLVSWSQSREHWLDRYVTLLTVFRSPSGLIRRGVRALTGIIPQKKRALR